MKEIVKVIEEAATSELRARTDYLGVMSRIETPHPLEMHPLARVELPPTAEEITQLPEASEGNFKPDAPAEQALAPFFGPRTKADAKKEAVVEEERKRKIRYTVLSVSAFSL